MLLVSLDCSLLIVHSVFSNVYDIFKVCIVQLDMDKKNNCWVVLIIRQNCWVVLIIRQNCWVVLIIRQN